MIEDGTTIGRCEVCDQERIVDEGIVYCDAQCPNDAEPVEEFEWQP